MDANSTLNLYDEQGFDFQLYHNSSHERGFLSSSRVGITICVGNIIINVLVLFLIIGIQSTRKQFVMSQVANIAVMDIMMCVFVDSLTIYYNIHPWSLGQTVCEAWLILDALLPFTALLGLILLNVDRILFAIKPSHYYSLFRSLKMRWIYLSLPWIVSSLLVVPIWLLCNVPMQHIPFMCIYALTESAGIASAVVSLFLPSIVITCLIMVVLVSVAYGLPTNLQEFYRLSFEGQSVNSRTILRRHNNVIIALCIVDIATLTMQLPFGTLSIMEPQCLADPCTSIIDLMLALSWLRSATPGIRALIWFLFTEIKVSCCFCIRSKYGNRSGRRRLVESVPMTSSMHTQQEQLVSTNGNEKINEVKLL